MSVPVSASPVVASSTTPGLLSLAVSAVTVTSPVAPETSIPSPATILVTLAAVLATGKTPVTSSVRSIPPDFIVTSPDDTLKLLELKLATPIVDVDAFIPPTVTVVELTVVRKPLVPAIVKSAEPPVSLATLESSAVIVTPVISPPPAAAFILSSIAADVINEVSLSANDSEEV